MQLKHYLTLASLAFLTYGLYVTPACPTCGASVGSQSSEMATPQEQSEVATPLQAAMRTLNAGQRSLKLALKVSNLDSASIRKTLAEMQSAALIGLQQPVNVPANLAASEADSFRLGFKLELARVLVVLIEAEQAALGADWAGFAAMEEQLAVMKKAGHDRFREE